MIHTYMCVGVRVCVSMYIAVNHTHTLATRTQPASAKGLAYRASGIIIIIIIIIIITIIIRDPHLAGNLLRLYSR
jgi:hypothetical protein